MIDETKKRREVSRAWYDYMTQSAPDSSEHNIPRGRVFSCGIRRKPPPGLTRGPAGLDSYAVPSRTQCELLRSVRGFAAGAGGRLGRINPTESRDLVRGLPGFESCLPAPRPGLSLAGTFAYWFLAIANTWLILPGTKALSEGKSPFVSKDIEFAVDILIRYAQRWKEMCLSVSKRLIFPREESVA